MPNMSYCRFHNTLQDLRDCWDNWDEINENDRDGLTENDEIELRCRKRLVKLCQQIADAFGEDDE